MTGTGERKPTSRSEMRQERLARAEGLPWLAGRIKEITKPSCEGARTPNPVTAARYLSDLAEELGGVISLSGGTIGDMLPPQFVRDAARDAIEAYPHYPGVKGYRDLRQAIARKLERDNGILADPEDEILPTIGCQQVLDSTFRLLVDPGDEVLLFDPEYASTAPAIEMAGGSVVPVPLSRRGAGWRLDFDELARRASFKTKLLVMSNPNNPTGIVYTEEELEQVADLAKTLGFWVLSDEEYEKTLFDGVKHQSIAALHGMKERTVTGYSFSKPFAMTAYRIGYMVGPAEIMDHMYGLLRFSIQACSAVGLRAAHALLTGETSSWLRASTASLEAKRDYLVERVNRIPGLKCNMPKGVYFVFPDVRELGRTSCDLAVHLLKEGRVSVVPGFQFGSNGEGHVRISFCPSLELIEEGMDRFERAIEKLF
ncbi:MAG: pyridoxal phosphate-dependent aminotransferase [Vicinamibacteria bacterium]